MLSLFLKNSIYLENIFIIQTLARFPEHHDAAAGIVSLAQYGKWITLGFGFLILLILTIRKNFWLLTVT